MNQRREKNTKKKKVLQIDMQTSNRYSRIKVILSRKEMRHMLQRIRRAGSDDWHKIVALYSKVMKAEEKQFVWDILGQHMETVLRKSLLHQQLWVAESEVIGIVGWCVILEEQERVLPSGVGEIYVCVAPEYRGNGVGKALVHQVIDAAWKEGIHKLIGSIPDDDVVGQKLYKGAGFRCVGVLLGHVPFGESYKNIVIVEKLLDKELG